ncbi:uncharacterized protein BCR38DRAFT_431538 [Pseudomassariella vexata]|uniref:Uncharacterized protein n=1 Tax=Pseudomassariella vexata TaxID=1141098 RepID=A0A1Y2E0C4_9PEZI|nr:uncharacterized protein BCR38DRAFT_431538 [Pseudomassariella vexata]ORY64982.1 hypothetical protein BCR38DRAFT_431538 [Pseudomassariella vexata]
MWIIPAFHFDSLQQPYDLRSTSPCSFQLVLLMNAVLVRGIAQARTVGAITTVQTVVAVLAIGRAGTVLTISAIRAISATGTVRAVRTVLA